MEKEELLKEILKYIRIEELVGDVLFDKLIFAKIDELVADTDNTLDNALAEMMKPIIKEFALEKLREALADYQAA